MAHPTWSYNAIIYEVNIRQYTPEGTFAAFCEHLPRLKDLGVTCLWLMPIHPIGVPHRKGSLGSYYSISDYKGVNPEFGTKEDLQNLISLAHSSGMTVIFDMVANHTAWDNKWIEEGHTDWYERDSAGNILSPFDWSDTAKLNYNNRDMRRAMIDAMRYWVEEFNIDGFREDMAGLVPIDFWREAIAELRSVKSDLFMLGEVESPEFHMGNCFDSSYAWEFGHLIERLAQGHANVGDLRWRLDADTNLFPSSAMKLRFTSNHDENSWSGTEFERMGDAAMCMAALTYVVEGIPLIYSGQEAGVNKRLAFFERDTIDWSGLSSYTSFYKELNRLKHSCSALRAPEQGATLSYINSSQPENILAFKRKDGNSTVIAIFNLTPYHLQPAFWDEDYNGDYKKLWHTNQELMEGQYDPFGPWECKIYYK